MEKIDADDIYVAFHEGKINSSNEYYSATEVDARFDRLMTDNKMLYETAHKANRLYAEAVSRAIEAEPLLAAVRALVEVAKELRECLNCWHINNGVPETTKRTRLMERSWDAIAAVEEVL